MGARVARSAPRHATEAGTPGQGARAARLVLALVLLGLAAAGFIAQGQFRIFETALAQHWLGLPLSGPVGRMDDLLYFSWSDGNRIGMRITHACTVVLLVIPFTVAGAIVLAFTRFSLLRVVAGLLAGVIMLLVVNQVRIALVALSIQHWGMTGYDISHKFVGTIVGLAGFTAALLLMLRISAGSHGSEVAHRTP